MRGRCGGVVEWASAGARVVVAAIAALVFAVAACAQPLFGPAAGSVGRAGVESGHGGHGWVIVPEPRGGGWLLVHLPPRLRAGEEGRLLGSQPGTARVAMRLEEAPQALAAVGDEVYLVFLPRNAPGGVFRQVYSLTAVASGLGDLWAYAPNQRLAAQPSLPGEGVLVGLAGTPLGPVALIDRGPREGSAGVESGEVTAEGVRATPRPPPDLSLSLLFGGVWRPLRLPPGAVAAESPDRVMRRFMLAASEQGVALLATRPARQATLWRAELSVDQVRLPERERERLIAAREDGGALDEAESEELLPLAPASIEWTESPLQVPVGDERSAILPTGPLALVGSRVVFIHTEGTDGLAVYSVGAGPAERLGGVGTTVVEGDSGRDGAGRRVASVVGVVGWVAGRRIGLVLAPPGEQGDRGASVMDAAMRLRIVEVSADTGGVLYDGPSRSGSPIDRDEFQAVLLVVLGVMTILLVWTIRGGGRGEVVRMPPGSALAEPSRRLVAAGIDFLVAGVVTGWVLGVPLLEVLSLRIVLGPEAELAAAGVLLGVGVGLSSVMEGFLGFSLGKLAMGMRVVAVKGPRGGTWRGPGLLRAIGRSVFRWVAAPIAIFGLGRPDGRHVGDRLTGTGVVVRTEEGADADEEEGAKGE